MAINFLQVTLCVVGEGLAPPALQTAIKPSWVKEKAHASMREEQYATGEQVGLPPTLCVFSPTNIRCRQGCSREEI